MAIDDRIQEKSEFAITNISNDMFIILSPSQENVNVRKEL